MKRSPKFEVRSPKWTRRAGQAALLSLLLGALVARAELQFKFDFKEVVPGVDQAHLKMQSKDGPWSIFVVRVDRSRSDLQIRPVLAQEFGKAVLPLSKLASGFKREGWRTVAAMNANLFAKGAGGFVAGLHIADGEVCSTPNWPNTETVWADHAGRLYITAETNGCSLTWPDGHTTPLRLNAPADTNAPALFIGAAKCAAPRQPEVSLVLELESTASPLLPPNAMRRARLAETDTLKTTSSAQAILIPGPHFQPQVLGLKPGAVFTISTRMSHDLSTAIWAVSGVPHLITDGKEHSYFARPPALGQPAVRHPLSLIGFNDHALFLVVVDGRQPGKSIGMGFFEVYELMRPLGCTELLNLDGGGSTTLWIEGEVVNSPSDPLRWQRPIANALLLLRRVD